MLRPKCPVTESARPNRPYRIGQTETAQTETARPNRPDRIVVYPNTHCHNVHVSTPQWHRQVCEHQPRQNCPVNDGRTFFFKFCYTTPLREAKRACAIPFDIHIIGYSESTSGNLLKCEFFVMALFSETC